MKYWFVFVLTLLLSQNLKGAPGILDSLKGKLMTAKHDTTKIRIIFAIIENIYDDNIWPDYNEKAKKIAIELSNHENSSISLLGQKGIAQVLNNEAYLLINQGQVDKGLTKHQKTLSIRNKIKIAFPDDIENNIGIALSLNNIAYVYKNQGKLSKSIEYHKLSLSIREEIGDKKGISMSLNNIAGMLENIGQIKDALELFNRSLKIRKEIGDKMGISYILNNIAVIYLKLGQVEDALNYFERTIKLKKEINDQNGIAYALNNIAEIYHLRGEIDQALEIHKRSIEIKQKIGDLKGISNSLNNIAVLYKIQKRFEEAIEAQTKTLAIKKQIKDITGLASSYINVGSLFLTQTKYTTALSYADSANGIAKELGYPEITYNVAKLYADIYRETGETKEGWRMYELYIEMRDSIENKENEKVVIKQLAQYQFEKEELIKKQEEMEYERELELLKDRSNNLQYSGMFISILALLGFIFLLGKFQFSTHFIRIAIFIALLLLFEFALIYLDSIIENITSGIPLLKLGVNAILASIIFPLHTFLEKVLQERLYVISNKNTNKLKG